MSTGAYLFDYGGTLDGEGWHWFDRFLHLYRAGGSILPEDAVKRAFYEADRRLHADARERGYRLRPLIERHVELQAETLGDETRRIARSLVDGFCRINDEGWGRARAALSRLRDGARLGVVSNFYGNLDVLLEEAGLAPLLDAVVESVDVGVEKPDPRIYRIALDRLRLPAAAVVMVGDNFERDLRPAKSLGMATVWLRRGETAPPEPGIADRVVGSLAEIGEP